jgi:Uncharacterized membrane protein
MAKLSAKILIVGETVYKIHTHFKGFASYETGYATLGLDSFISRFAGTGLDISFMPNHEASLRFPMSVEAMQAYDLIVISDAPPIPSCCIRTHSVESCCKPAEACRRLRPDGRRLCHDWRLDVVRRVSRKGALRLFPDRGAAAGQDRAA